MHRVAWRGLFLVGVVVVVVVAGVFGGVPACKRTAPTPAPSPENRLVVFAAASLRDAFTTMQTDFLWAHPGVEVTFNFGGTQALRAQLEHGAAADVFASADMHQMGELARQARVEKAVVFARNEPVLVVTKEAAAKVHSFADLPRVDRIVLGGPEVPIGRYTQTILERAAVTLGADFVKRVDAKVVSREPDVRQVLAKVTLGEAQAAIVYQSDARAARDAVVVVRIPPPDNVSAEYPIAVVAGAAHPTLAHAWVDFVMAAGQQALRDAGFQSPPGAPSAAANPRAP